MKFFRPFNEGLKFFPIFVKAFSSFTLKAQEVKEKLWTRIIYSFCLQRKSWSLLSYSRLSRWATGTYYTKLKFNVMLIWLFWCIRKSIRAPLKWVHNIKRIFSSFAQLFWQLPPEIVFHRFICHKNREPWISRSFFSWLNWRVSHHFKIKKSGSGPACQKVRAIIQST